MDRTRLFNTHWSMAERGYDCPSQMNENLKINKSKFASDSELRWERFASNLSLFVRENHAGCVSYNGNDGRWWINS